MSASPSNRTGGIGVRRLGNVDHDALASLLDVHREWNAFLIGWLTNHGVEPADPNAHYTYVGAWVDGRLAGCALLAGQEVCCLSSGPAAALAPIGAALAPRLGTLRTIVGPLGSVLAFLSGASVSPTDATLVQRQTLMGLRDEVPFDACEPLLMSASDHDVPDLARASIEMHAEETGRWPTSRERDLFLRSVRHKVASGRVWCLRNPMSNALLFKASVSAFTDDLTQVEGVWVEPSVRRRGVGRRAMGELCRRLAVGGRSVSLYANSDNEAALRLYEVLGFEQLGPFMTVFWRFPSS